MRQKKVIRLNLLSARHFGLESILNPDSAKTFTQLDVNGHDRVRICIHCDEESMIDGDKAGTITLRHDSYPVAE